MRTSAKRRAERKIIRYLTAPVPDSAVADLRDLGVIGYANELPDVTHLMMQHLIAEARRNGRSWQEIGRRLEMTASETERAYREVRRNARSVRPVLSHGSR